MRFYHRKHEEKNIMSERNAKEKNKWRMQCQV